MESHKQARIVFATALILLATACATEPGVEDTRLGLSKDSVFSTPDPIVAVNEAGEPGENETLGAYFSGSPPVIPHQIEEFLPVRVGENLCLDCHDLPDLIGEELETGDPTPMPASHYTDLRRSPDEVTPNVIGARYVCTLCHAPQTNAEPLVINTYRQ
jgi:cytochrome c-type protein NapB